MMRNLTIAAAALVSLGLSASPASAFLGDVCYNNEGAPSGLAEVFRLSVKLHGPLSNVFERPKVLAYSVHGKTGESVQGVEGGAAMSGTVLVGTGDGARMTLNLPGSWVGCTSTESSPTPREWTCNSISITPAATPSPTAPANLTVGSTSLKRVDPRQNPLCSGLPPVPPSLP